MTEKVEGFRIDDKKQHYSPNANRPASPVKMSKRLGHNEDGGNGASNDDQRSRRYSKFRISTSILFIISMIVPLMLITSSYLSNILASAPVNSKIELELLELFKKSEKMLQSIADSRHTFYDEHNKILGTTYFSKNVYSRQPYVSNGYIGARISTLGQGFAYDEISIHQTPCTEDALNNGWPLFNKRYTGAFAAGFFSLMKELPATNYPELYNDGYDSVISSIPYWPSLGIELNMDGEVYSYSPEHTTDVEVSNYVQNMSIENGLVSTQLTWLNNAEIQTQVFTHKEIAPLGIIKVVLKSLYKPLNVTIENKLDLSTVERSYLRNLGHDEGESGGIFMEVSPDNVDYSKAAIYSAWDWDVTNTTVISDEKGVISEKAQIVLEPNVPVTIHKYVGIVTSEYLENDTESELELAKRYALKARETQYEKLYETHTEAWRKQFQTTNINIPSDGLLTLAARASLYHLFANTRHDSKGLTSSLSSTGLSSDSYGGMVFWDTDLWIVPALIPFAPDDALAVSRYRNYTHEQARLNAKQYSFEGAAYPWTSGRFGNCTSTGPCIDYEYHVNIDIVLSVWLLYLAGGDETYLRYTVWPLMRDAADFLTDYTVFDPDLKKYVTYNMTDPDEYANHIDNAAFTNAGIDSLLKWTLMVANHLNEDVNPRWLQVQNSVYIPRSPHGITLEYSGMNASISIKQADVVLLSFPLDFNDFHDSFQAKRDLFWYSLKQADVGPAMTFPIFTIAASKLLHHGCSSQSYLQKSVLPYLRSPFAQFSEQADDNVLTNGGTHPAFPFLTAHGGYIQALIYGISGLRYSARVSQDLKIERYLIFDPAVIASLPRGVQIIGFQYLGQKLDIIITDFKGIIVHKGNKPIKVEVGERNAKAGNYTIKPGSQFIIPLFRPHLNCHRSLSECMPIANLTVGSPGDVPLSAIDGNNYTYWQPLNREPAKLLIDLRYPQKIKSGFIVWGSRPAKKLTISFTEELSFSFDQVLENFNKLHFVKVVDGLDMEISEPYDEKYLKEVKLLPHNVTNFEIDKDKHMITRFVLVEITDAIDEIGEEGGTLNEIAFFR